MKLPDGEQRSRTDPVLLDGAPTGPWLAIGPLATQALTERLGPHHEIIEAPSLHRALMTLERNPPMGCLAEAACIEPRPRAGLEVLLKGLEGAPLWMLGPALTDETRQVADEIGVPIVTAPWRRAPDRPAERPVSRSRVAPLRRGPEAEAPAARVPRLAEGAFLQGCVEHQGDVSKLGTWIHDAFADLSGAERSSLLLRDDTKEAGYHLFRARGPHAHFVDEKDFKPDPRGCALWSAARARPRFGYGHTQRYDCGAYVVLPLIHDGESVAIISLTKLPEDRLPDPEDRTRWWRLAADAAHFLHTARELETARENARTDPKTHLPNARAFEEALHREHERVRRHGGAYGVLIFDIDHFRKVNKDLTHPIADIVLLAVARVLKASFREADVVSRWGGEEFAVLLTDLDRGQGGETPAGADPLREVLQAAERARQRIRDHRTQLPGGRSPYGVTVSGGLALHPEDAGDPAALVVHAAEALRTAKAEGRDRVEWYGHPRS